MTKQEAPPYDSDNLTPAERACERDMARNLQSCKCCDNLKLHPRSGATVCEEKQNMRLVLNGKKCDYFNARRQ